MLLIIQIFLVFSIVVIVLIAKGYSVKRKLQVPLYYLFLGGDVGGRKPIKVENKNLVGMPDALFFNLLKLRFVVCEFKSRNYTGVNLYERAQITLYMGMLNKWYLPAPQGIVAYGNGFAVRVRFNKSLFNEICGLRKLCLVELGKF